MRTLLGKQNFIDSLTLLGYASLVALKSLFHWKLSQKSVDLFCWYRENMWDAEVIPILSDFRFELLWFDFNGTVIIIANVVVVAK